MTQAMPIKSINTVSNHSKELTHFIKERNPLSYNETLTKNGIHYPFLYNSGPGDIETYMNRLINLNRLEDIRQLEDDWNGYNAQSIPKTVLDKGIKFIESVDEQPVIYPTGRRSIHMQYDLEDRSYLEFEIFEDKVTCMKVPKRIYDQATFETFSSMDTNKFNKIVEEFYEEHNRQK